jgi:hypothetical protein
VQDETAEVKLCESAIDVRREKLKGSEIVVAHIFSVEETDKKTSHIHPELQKVLNQFEEIFIEPTTLPSKRSVDHAIPLISENRVAIDPKKVETMVSWQSLNQSRN